MARHAIALEDKQARRAAILTAAGALFLAGDGSLPAAGDIATAAGLAKGTVYLYFRTKEEIFVTLLLDGLLTLLGEIEATVAGARGPRRAKVAAFLATYVGYVERRTDLLRLDALCQGAAGEALDPGRLRASRIAFLERLTATGAAVDRALRLPAGRGVQLLTRTFALTGGVWQSARWSEEFPAVDGRPALALARTPFLAELAEALSEYWRGALANRDAVR